MVGLNHQPVWHCHNICYPGAFARWSLQICSWTFVPHQVQFFGNNSATQTDPKRWNYLGNTWKNHRYRVDPGGICSVIFCGIYISWYFLDFLEILGLWTGIPMCSPSFGGGEGFRLGSRQQNLGMHRTHAGEWPQVISGRWSMWVGCGSGHLRSVTVRL